MAKNCVLCSEKLVEDDLNKLNGTLVKLKNSDNVNEFYYACNICQREHKDQIKQKVIELLKK